MSISDDINALADLDVEPGVAEVFEEAPPTNAASSTSPKFEDRCAGPKAREEGVHSFVRCLEAAIKEVEPWILDGDLFGCRFGRKEWPGASASSALASWARR